LWDLVTRGVISAGNFSKNTPLPLSLCTIFRKVNTRTFNRTSSAIIKRRKGQKRKEKSNRTAGIMKQGASEDYSLGIKLLSAGTAACIADLATFPLDTAKVRMQVSKIIHHSIRLYPPKNDEVSPCLLFIRHRIDISHA